ncbi:hypothetical protein [Calothrix sp. CCY 0018]|uniref:hypothetical protein n=1 Tax=Calothrix sp. CCY 0018 TaxID=3103864 RepID=UPI0039C739D9
MTQLSLADVVEQTKSEIEVDAQGRGKASVRAAARLADVSGIVPFSLRTTT